LPQQAPPKAQNYLSAHSKNSHDNVIGAHLLRNKEMVVVNCASMFATPQRPDLSPINSINSASKQAIVVYEQKKQHSKNLMSFGNQPESTTPVQNSPAKARNQEKQSPAKAVNPRVSTSPPDKSQGMHQAF
jgi:hypothetical protein